MTDPSVSKSLDTKGCPSPSVLAAYAEASLGASERARVKAHIRSCEDCDLVAGMVGPPAAAIEQSVGPDASVASFLEKAWLAIQLAPGTNLGRFRILSSVGRGAMGIVYAAYDAQLDRKVALKVLLDDRDEQSTRDRLLREARSMAKLDHPNIVKVFDVGAAEGRVYLAMQLIDGSTLAEWLDRRPSRDRIVALFVDVARALDAAHRAGVVHRDLKPHNILVSSAGVAMVTDFGLADTSMALSEALPSSTVLATTRTRGIIGTPAYMAPEVLLGERGKALSDQFSFAVCLHEALTGRRPYQARTIAELESQVRTEVLQIDRAVDEPIARVLRRALARSPDDRFSSMADLGSELERVGTPRKMKAPLLAIGAGIGALVAAGLFVASSRHTPKVETTPTPAPASVRAPALATPATTTAQPAATATTSAHVATRRAAPVARPAPSSPPSVAPTAAPPLESEGPKGSSSAADDWLRSRR